MMEVNKTKQKMNSAQYAECAGVHHNGSHSEIPAGLTRETASVSRESKGDSITLDGYIPDEPQRELEHITRRQLELIGADVERDGLLKTPARVAKALSQLTRGYRQNVWDVVGDAIFEEKYRGMVLVRDIEVYSLCEHHLLPFIGKAHVAYIPSGKVIGLSKLPRIVEVFARRLQVQERLTEQIASAVEEVLHPEGVGVIIEALHLCMMMRGVEKQNATTVTSVRRGVFLDDPHIHGEFQRLVHARSSPW